MLTSRPQDSKLCISTEVEGIYDAWVYKTHPISAGQIKKKQSTNIKRNEINIMNDYQW